MTFGTWPGSGGEAGSPPGNGTDTLTPEVGVSALINPWDNPTAWQSIMLDDDPSPGLIVECAGMNPRKWDKKDGTGITGATVVFNGEGLAEFDVRIQLGWEGPTLPKRAEQWAQWAVWKRHLLPPTTKNPTAKRIWYPSLDQLPVPIVAVIVRGNGAVGPKQVADGVWEWLIQFQQFRAPKPASSKPKGASGKGKGDGESKDATDALIDKLDGIGNVLDGGGF